MGHRNAHRGDKENGTTRRLETRRAGPVPASPGLPPPTSPALPGDAEVGKAPQRTCSLARLHLMTRGHLQRADTRAGPWNVVEGGVLETGPNAVICYGKSGDDLHQPQGRRSR